MFPKPEGNLPLGYTESSLPHFQLLLFGLGFNPGCSWKVHAVELTSPPSHMCFSYEKGGGGALPRRRGFNI